MVPASGPPNRAPAGRPYDIGYARRNKAVAPPASASDGNDEGFLAVGRRPLIIVTCVLLVTWALLGLWQYREYGGERHLAEEVLTHQGEAIGNALVGGIRSHRRLGRFFEEQIQAMLNEFAGSENVLAVSLRSQDGSVRLTAGDPSQLNTLDQAQPGWLAQGFLCEQQFKIPADTGGTPVGRGGGFGPGWGRGRAAAQVEDAAPLAAGGTLVIRLLLDRSHTDQQLRGSAWLRCLLVAASGLFLLAVALAWRASIRLLDARAHTELLEVEARRLRDLSQAAAGLAHETRNPLGLIRGWVQRLTEGGLPASQLTQAQAVIEECDRVTARINQFIAFARSRPPQAASVEIRPLVEELGVLLEPDLEAKQLVLDPSQVPPGICVEADRELLRQALFNLLGNAVQFSPRQGTIEVAATRSQDSRLRIEVADRGPGVAADAVASLFTPYFTTRPNGTGLGLAIVQQIAAVHGWQAGYRARAGGGAVFWLDQIHGG